MSYEIETVQDFLIKLDIKPLMYQKKSKIEGTPILKLAMVER